MARVDLGQHTREERVTKKENPGYLQTVSLKYLVHAIEDTAQSQGKNSLKGLKGTVPGTHIGPGIVPTLTSQTRKMCNSQGIGQSTQEGLDCSQPI